MKRDMSLGDLVVMETLRRKPDQPVRVAWSTAVRLARRGWVVHNYDADTCTITEAGLEYMYNRVPIPVGGIT